MFAKLASQGSFRTRRGPSHANAAVQGAHQRSLRAHPAQSATPGDTAKAPERKFVRNAPRDGQETGPDDSSAIYVVPVCLRTPFRPCCAIPAGSERWPQTQARKNAPNVAAAHLPTTRTEVRHRFAVNAQAGTLPSKSRPMCATHVRQGTRDQKKRVPTIAKFASQATCNLDGPPSCALNARQATTARILGSARARLVCQAFFRLEMARLAARNALLGLRPRSAPHQTARSARLDLRVNSHGLQNAQAVVPGCIHAEFWRLPSARIQE